MNNLDTQTVKGSIRFEKNYFKSNRKFLFVWAKDVKTYRRSGRNQSNDYEANSAKIKIHIQLKSLERWKML